MADDCDPPIIEPGAGGPNPPELGEVTIGDINIEELDTTGSGAATVTRCVGCDPVDLVVAYDENHAGGQGVTTDEGTKTVEVVGWVGPDGVYTPGPYDDSLGPLGPCPCLEDQVTVTETVVCADDAPAIRHVETGFDGTATVTFIGADGAAVTPTAWTPGPCPPADTTTTIEC